MNNDTGINNSAGRIAFNKTGKVLIVDDEHLIRKSLSRYLSKIGYTVDVAEDGRVALEKLKHEVYDLVLTDLKMPNLDGRELLTMMSDEFPDIPKIVLTGCGTNDDIIHALKTGAYDFLNKPIVDFTILYHSVERALDRKRLNDEKNRYVAQQRQIYDIITMLNRGKKTEEIFTMLKDSLRSIIPFSRLFFGMIDNETRALVIRLTDSQTDGQGSEGERVSLQNTFLEEISLKSDVLLIDDVRKFMTERNDPFIKKLYEEENILSMIVLPIIIDNVTRGYLFFCSDAMGGFTEEHILFMKSISGQISFGIQRGELLDQLELYTKNLEQLVKVRTHEILKTQKTTIFALSKLSELRDPETGEHLERMRNFSVLIAQILKYSGYEMDITNQYLRDLYDSSILHDIGKVGIPDNILLKPGPLTPEEFEIIKTHTTIGHNALKLASKDLGENSFLKMAMEVTLYHHEMWEGGGYPTGIKGTDIPLAARIVTIADVYDALTSDRPYKKAFSHTEGIEIMKKESYRFDPVLFKIFLDNEAEIDRIRIQFH